MMSRWLALYRGLNVGRRRVTMDRLRAAHESVGATQIRTFLASGNVVFSMPDTDRNTLARSLEAAFQREAGFSSEVTLRTADELRDAIARNPFLGAGYEPKFAHTVFLRQPPTLDAIRAFLQDHDGPEELDVGEREAFVYYTRGMARSGVDLGRLGVTSTSRNANTVGRLLALLED
jgi:uncharacterized protein (DUF1697 family)